MNHACGNWAEAVGTTRPVSQIAHECGFADHSQSHVPSVQTRRGRESFSFERMTTASQRR
jgi:hypothetical protein